MPWKLTRLIVTAVVVATTFILPLIALGQIAGEPEVFLAAVIAAIAGWGTWRRWTRRYA